jgi:hypothetical protein
MRGRVAGRTVPKGRCGSGGGRGQLVLRAAGDEEKREDVVGIVVRGGVIGDTVIGDAVEDADRR